MSGAGERAARCSARDEDVALAAHGVDPAPCPGLAFAQLGGAGAPLSIVDGAVRPACRPPGCTGSALCVRRRVVAAADRTPLRLASRRHLDAGDATTACAPRRHLWPATGSIGEALEAQQPRSGLASVRRPAAAQARRAICAAPASRGSKGLAGSRQHADLEAEHAVQRVSPRAVNITMPAPGARRQLSTARNRWHRAASRRTERRRGAARQARARHPAPLSTPCTAQPSRSVAHLESSRRRRRSAPAAAVIAAAGGAQKHLFPDICRTVTVRRCAERRRRGARRPFNGDHPRTGAPHEHHPRQLPPPRALTAATRAAGPARHLWRRWRLFRRRAPANGVAIGRPVHERQQRRAAGPTAWENQTSILSTTRAVVAAGRPARPSTARAAVRRSSPSRAATRSAVNGQLDAGETGVTYSNCTGAAG